MKTFKEFVAEAISRKPSVQRAPDLSARARQQRQAREDRRAAARDRVSDKIDALIGSDEERSAAAAARKKQPEIQRELRRKSTRDRMAAAAKKLGLDEGRTKEQQIKGQQAMLDQKIKDEYDKVTKEVPRTTKYLKK